MEVKRAITPEMERKTDTTPPKATVGKRVRHSQHGTGTGKRVRKSPADVAAERARLERPEYVLKILSFGD